MLHRMSPPVYDVSVPAVLRNALRTYRVDRGDGGCGLLDDRPMLSGHSIIAGDEHPGWLLCVVSSQTPQQFGVLDVSGQVKRCNVDSPPASSIQLNREALGEISVDDEKPITAHVVYAATRSSVDRS